MFANPWWSVLLIAAPAALYALVIRPRLKARFTDIYRDIDSFWARLTVRLYAFRTYVLGSIGVVLAALPDLLVLITPLDFSFLPQPWPGYIAIGFAVTTWVMKAFETKPREDR